VVLALEIRALGTLHCPLEKLNDEIFLRRLGCYVKSVKRDFARENNPESCREREVTAGLHYPFCSKEIAGASGLSNEKTAARNVTAGLWIKLRECCR